MWYILYISVPPNEVDQSCNLQNLFIGVRIYLIQIRLNAKMTHYIERHWVRRACDQRDCTGQCSCIQKTKFRKNKQSPTVFLISTIHYRPHAKSRYLPIDYEIVHVAIADFIRWTRTWPIHNAKSAEPAILLHSIRYCCTITCTNRAQYCNLTIKCVLNRKPAFCLDSSPMHSFIRRDNEIHLSI